MTVISCCERTLYFPGCNLFSLLKYSVRRQSSIHMCTICFERFRFHKSECGIFPQKKSGQAPDPFSKLPLYAWQEEATENIPMVDTEGAPDLWPPLLFWNLFSTFSKRNVVTFPISSSNFKIKKKRYDQ